MIGTHHEIYCSLSRKHVSKYYIFIWVKSCCKIIKIICYTEHQILGWFDAFCTLYIMIHFIQTAVIFRNSCGSNKLLIMSCFKCKQFWGDKFNAVYTIEIFNSGTNWKIVIIDHSGLIFLEGGVFYDIDPAASKYIWKDLN